MKMWIDHVNMVTDGVGVEEVIWRVGLENRNKNEPQGTTVVSGEVEKEDLVKKSGKHPKRKEQQQQTYLGVEGGNRKANEASQK